MEQKIYPICVIGGGAAGTMAVLRAVLNNDECLFFPGSPKDKKRSRAMWVRKIENMPAHFQYKKGIEEPNAETLKWISESPFKENLHIQKNLGVAKLTKREDGIFEIVDSKDGVHYAQYVVLCTGVMDVQPKIGGTIDTVFDYANAQTIDYCLICDGHHTFGKKTTIIGHTNSTAWTAIILHERYNCPIMILTNGEKPEFHADTQKLLELYKIQVETDEILEILGEERGKILKGFVFKDRTIDCDICFISMGMIVYNELAKQLGAEIDERGFVKADEHGLTTVPGLYVAGDIKANTRKQIYTSWDMAVSALNHINLQLRSHRRHKMISSANS